MFVSILVFWILKIKKDVIVHLNRKYLLELIFDIYRNEVGMFGMEKSIHFNALIGII